MADPDVELYVPFSALNAYLYCAHRAYREYFLREWAHNFYTADASERHRRVDEARRERSRSDITKTTRVWLKSDSMKLYGVADVVESSGDAAIPVEYKRGKAGPWPNDKVQLCAQALCLEEQAGVEIQTGYIWYFGSRRRCRIQFTPELRSTTVETVKAVYDIMIGLTVPPPEYHPGRCAACSLQPLCLPEETALLMQFDPANMFHIS